MKISVIIPVFNHSSILFENINRIITTLDSICLNDYELIIINDGSTDNSNEIITQLSHSNIIKISQTNSGLGSVLSKGFDIANGDFIIYTDIDLSYGLDLIPFMIESMNQYDCIVGSKYLSRENNYPDIRRIYSWLHYWFIRIFFSIYIRDTGSGLVCIKAGFVKNITLKSKGFGIHFELFHHLYTQKAIIIELPVRYIHKIGSFKIHRHLFITIYEIITYSIDFRIRKCYLKK